MEGFTDYFRPKTQNAQDAWCKMLNKNNKECFHQWLSPDGWITIEKENCTPVRVFLGGSSPEFMKHFPGDNRTTLPFWGCNCNNYKGGCNGMEWEKNFTLRYAQGKKYIKNRNSNYIF